MCIVWCAWPLYDVHGHYDVHYDVHDHYDVHRLK